MAINRGTNRETFVYFLEVFAVLGVIGGVGIGIYQSMGKQIPELMTSVFQIGFMGFIVGSAIGIVLGVLAVLLRTIFR
jgi:hypothetical protein